MEQSLALGIDLGGTSVKVGVVRRDGAILGRGQAPTEASQGVSVTVANMARAARQAAAEAGVALSTLEGAGIGAPGTCDAPRGILIHGTNLGWHNVPVTDLLKQELGLPVFLENDANCAALGEHWCGSGRGTRQMVLLTIGTGVGGGLILNGGIFQGHSGWAGEIGHMRAVENGPACNCGLSGCLETVASATAMGNLARQAIESGQAPLLARMAAEPGALVDARLVISAARTGDEPALAILRMVGTHLGNAIGTLVTVLNPELIVIGGGASAAGDLLLDPVRVAIETRAMPGPSRVVQVRAAQLGNDAGLIGAASLVWR